MDRFFGKGYWSNKVFWLNVPPRVRTANSNGYLQKMLKTWGDLGEDILSLVSLLPLQRDPYEVDTRETNTEWFYVTGIEKWDDPDLGQVFRMIGEPNFLNMPATDPAAPPSADLAELAVWFPWFPYAPISKTAAQWETRIDGARYEVVNVRARNYDPPEMYRESFSLGNEIWVSGGDLVLDFDFTTGREWDPAGEETLLAQSIGAADGSLRPSVMIPGAPLRLVRNVNPVSGLTADARLVIRIPYSLGDVYLYDLPVDEDHGTLNVGSGGVITGVELGTVNYLSGKISLSLASSFDQEYGAPIRAKYMVRGRYIRFNSPSMIEHLARDYGFDSDENDPDDVQRSAVANVTKYWAVKAGSDSYRIRGEISLLTVRMAGLFSLCSVEVAQQLPAGKVREIGMKLYTEQEPRYVRYDDIRADEQFYDAQYGSGSPVWVPLTDNNFVSDDSTRWDGMSIGMAYALDVTQGYWGGVSAFNSTKRGPAKMTSATQLSTDVLDALGWVNGYEYVVQMLRCQAEAFNFGRRPSLFALSKYTYNILPALGTPPAPGDSHYPVDRVVSEWTMTTPSGGDPWEDVGEMTVRIAFGAEIASPLSVGDDIAVRYLPPIARDCCYCRSNRMLGYITVTEDAYSYYPDLDSIDRAIERMKIKLGTELKPKHVEIALWEVSRKFKDGMAGVESGAAVVHYVDPESFANNIGVTMTVQYRGDAVDAPRNVFLELFVNYVSVWSILWHGGADDGAWHEVAAASIAVSGIPEEVRLEATAAAGSARGDVEWIFDVTKEEV